MTDITIRAGDFTTTSAELVPHTEAGRAFLAELVGAIGMPAPLTVGVRKSALQRVSDLADERGLAVIWQEAAA